MASSKMRVLHVIQNMSPARGGPSFQVAELVGHLQRQGIDNVVLSFERADNRTYIDKVRSDGGRIVELTSVLARYPISIPLFHHLPRLARESDVVHLWGYWGFHNLVYRCSPACLRTPFVISALSNMPIVLRSRAKKAIFHRAVGLPLLARARMVVAITEAEAQEYAERGVGAERIKLIPLAVPDEFYRAVSPRPREQAETLRILFIGRVHEKKGIQFVLPALARLRAEVPAFKLLVVGPDEGYGAELERKTRELGLGDVVEFPGPAYEDRKREYFRDADIFILPSMFEQIGHSILEGAAAGLPCLYTAGCAFSALARAGGGIETDGTQSELLEALRSLLTDAQLRDRMGRAARAFIGGGYLWSQIASAYADMYREAAGHPAKIARHELAGLG